MDMLSKTKNDTIDINCSSKREVIDAECGDIEDNNSDCSMNINSYKTATAMSNYFSSIDASEIVSSFQFSHTIESIIESEL
ncbi:uncharacterized protein ELE39_001621 [Cryptosporidium sp. chipmunk genotype I]|uniref:uncharacterized protein n=1 Tax=Cryptosporidium sp. chipmunk genotype I TaxID=1280935 RepID=UPI003519EB19|nr:hypothetical protein ELE39_001621 [Cryptosporidium sp. chipmunk genotype I]